MTPIETLTVFFFLAVFILFLLKFSDNVLAFIFPDDYAWIRFVNKGNAIKDKIVKIKGKDTLKINGVDGYILDKGNPVRKGRLCSWTFEEGNLVPKGYFEKTPEFYENSKIAQEYAGIRIADLWIVRGSLSDDLKKILPIIIILGIGIVAYYFLHQRGVI